MNFRAPIDSGYPDLTVIADKDAVVTADGLAVDWVYNHVYWTDTGERHFQGLGLELDIFIRV